MATALKIGQVLKGKKGLYTIAKRLQGTVWLATNGRKENAIIKTVDRSRIFNERDILLRFQSRTPYLRPLIDEIQIPGDTPAIVLKHLQDDMLNASDMKRLTRSEVKYVAKNVLEALKVLHGEGFVHTDIKPSNVLVNYGQGDIRFADVQLADFGSTVSMDSAHALNGDPIGTPIFKSLEAYLQIRWSTSTDIWSFGAMLISLLYGEGFHIFRPDVPVDHEDYDTKILLNHYRCFGPFPESYAEIADEQRRVVLAWIVRNSPCETLRPFYRTSTAEISEEDKRFVLSAMKLDPRDRPTAHELLGDEWFRQP